MRIVTLLPSATEIVCALGLGDRLVGVSHSCDYPPLVRRLPTMTSSRVPYRDSSDAIDTFVREHLAGHDALYDLDIERLTAASPDVVVSQTLCDVCAVATGDVEKAICSLPSRPELIDLDPETLDDVLVDIERVGGRLSRAAKARLLVDALRSRRDAVAQRTRSIPETQRPRVAFLEWLDPPFNGGHWNPELIGTAGGIDLLGNHGLPSRTLTWEDVARVEPEVLFIACCGFDIDRALEDVNKLQGSETWRALPAVRNGRVYVADGSAYFACPGPRLIDGLEIMAHALHPHIHPEPDFGAVHIVPTDSAR